MLRERILVVDDEPSITELCRRCLSAEGYHVATASSGETALEALRKQPFDLVLTDIRMPGMSGLELMRAVKSRDEQITVVVITGHGTITTAIESLKQGALGFVVKPFTSQELLSAVRHATEKNMLIKENVRLKSLLPLLEVSKTLLFERDLAALVHLISSVAQRETRSDRCALFLIENNSKGFILSASLGFPHDVEVEKMFRPFLEKTLLSPRPFFLHGQDLKESGLLSYEKGMTCFLASPLLVREKSPGPYLSQPVDSEKAIGILCLAKMNQESPFSESDLELTSILSGQAAAALENAMLSQQIRDGYMRTVMALATALEVKDPYTRGHTARVAGITAVLARKLGVSDLHVEEVRLVALLHDVGKIGSHDEILLKKGPLTPEEYEVMKDHPRDSVRMLEPTGLPSSLITAVLHHHEWYDGSGYPNGLSHDDIPLASRILSVADAFDAMTSTRPYRVAMPIEEAKKELLTYSGTQFDPVVAETLIKLIEKEGMAFYQPVGSDFFLTKEP